MVRLNMTRKEKARRRRVGTLNTQLSSLTHFGDIGALTGAAAPTGEVSAGPVKGTVGGGERPVRLSFRLW